MTRWGPPEQERRPESPVADGARGMNQADVIASVASLPGVVTVTASEKDGAPDVAWGDSFFYYDPEGDNATGRRMPFATIVTKDYDGFDTASKLDRPGAFRVNIAVGRARFEELLGCPPAEHADRSAAVDYAATDELVPHPVYAIQAWVAIVNPAERTAALLTSLLTDAHARAVRRHHRRASTESG